MNRQAAVAPTLAVHDLRVGFRTRGGVFTAVDGVDFEVRRGETLGVVGESGSGKSVTMLAILGLLPRPPAWIVEGAAVFEGRDLLGLAPSALREVRGRRVAMIFQNPGTSLNPVFSVGSQIGEAIKVHRREADRPAVQRRVIELLRLVGIADPERRARQYPHEFSGGMAQRVMIAMALANDPALLIADEPTTALDVTIQAQILEVLRGALRESETSLILITHNLGLVAEIADRVAVMYAGRVVETADVDAIFHRPRHPYTEGLLQSLPSILERSERLAQIPGQPPSPERRPAGCPFQPRCALSHGRDACREELPPLVPSDRPDHLAACHFWPEMQR
ncbi:MAG: ABC transporter ATP-binding protein [Candidatus Dormiibacterota bacterium]